MPPLFISIKINGYALPLTLSFSFTGTKPRGSMEIWVNGNMEGKTLLYDGPIGGVALVLMFILLQEPHRSMYFETSPFFLYHVIAQAP